LFTWHAQGAIIAYVQVLQILQQYRATLKATHFGAPAQAVKKHKERGKLLARERIDAGRRALAAELGIPMPPAIAATE
jgi:hypothetical protein